MIMHPSTLPGTGCPNQRCCTLTQQAMQSPRVKLKTNAKPRQTRCRIERSGNTKTGETKETQETQDEKRQTMLPKSSKGKTPNLNPRGLMNKLTRGIHRERAWKQTKTGSVQRVQHDTRLHNKQQLTKKPNCNRPSIHLQFLFFIFAWPQAIIGLALPHFGVS